jgi:hypothetical protein
MIYWEDNWLNRLFNRNQIRTGTYLIIIPSSLLFNTNKEDPEQGATILLTAFGILFFSWSGRQLYKLYYRDRYNDKPPTANKRVAMLVGAGTGLGLMLVFCYFGLFPGLNE